MSTKAAPVLPYTVPTICKTNDNDWYIWFRFYHDGKWSIPIKSREGINRIKDAKLKEDAADALRQVREHWLKLGWNPITDPEFKLRTLKFKERRNEMTLNEALQFGFDKKKQAKKGKATYKCCLDFIEEVGKTTGYGLLNVKNIDRGICLELLDKCAEIHSWSNHAYNKHLGVMRAMFTECVQYRVMDINYLLNTRAKDVPESNFFDAYTEEEKVQITEHLHFLCFGLWVVMQVVYHTGIRPKEALALQICNIDLKASIITIAPDEERENSKTNNVRKVPINPHLHKILSKMQLDKYPGHYFVFGSPFESSKGNRGSGSERLKNEIQAYGAMRKGYFLPSQNQIKRDTITKLWKRLIMDEPVLNPVTGDRVLTSYIDLKTGQKVQGSLGLGIKKHLYAAKGTGCDDMVEAGLELKEVQILYGHQSEHMTARYNKKKRQLLAQKAILEKAPAFTVTSKLKAV